MAKSAADKKYVYDSKIYNQGYGPVTLNLKIAETSTATHEFSK